MSRRLYTLALSLMLAAFALLPIACGGDETPATEDAQPATIGAPESAPAERGE